MSGRGPGARAFALSAAVHAALLVPLVVFARPPEPMEFETVRINLVSPPPAAVAQAQTDSDPTPPPAPEPEPVREEPEPEVPREEPPEDPPEREDVERPDTEKRPETPAQTQPQPTPTEAAPEAATGGDDLNIATEGREFPFPDYLANVIVQVKRYFRWDGDPRLSANVYFEIAPDGEVRTIRIVESSGNLRFDIAVEGAVESAGNRSAFGPLPQGYAGPFLPVRVLVEPPR